MFEFYAPAITPIVTILALCGVVIGLVYCWILYEERRDRG